MSGEYVRSCTSLQERDTSGDCWRCELLEAENAKLKEAVQDHLHLEEQLKLTRGLCVNSEAEAKEYTELKAENTKLEGENAKLREIDRLAGEVVEEYEEMRKFGPIHKLVIAINALRKAREEQE